MTTVQFLMLMSAQILIAFVSLGIGGTKESEKKSVVFFNSEKEKFDSFVYEGRVYHGKFEKNGSVYTFNNQWDE